ncbi:hypothetical protein L218DRAFT_1009194 [Marasmius fiardii PR-910]|nr:hypothetical protein L218DRAFT_1009194 [Marasmius fiardii PR-910]
MSDPTAAAPQMPQGINISTSYGYMLVGTILGFVLWGISCMQCFLYYSKYADDSIWLKILVGALWCLDTPNVFLMLSGLWNVLISDWGNPAGLFASPKDIDHHVWLSGVVTLIVQWFFVWRIYHLATGNLFKYWIPGFITFLSFYAFAATIPFVVIAITNGTLESTQTLRIKALEASSRSCMVAVDLLITTSLLRVLLQHGMPGFSRSRQMLRRVILVTINSGMWTAVCAFISLILMTCVPLGFQYTIIEFPLGSLYYTTLLSNLNSRKYIRGRKTDWNEYMSSTGGSGGKGDSSAGPVMLSALRTSPNMQFATRSDISESGHVMVKSQTDIEAY